MENGDDGHHTQRVSKQIHGVAGAASLAGGLILSSPNSARAVGPNDKIRVALIGCGGMGGGDLKTFFLNPEVECPVVCDVDDARIADKIKIVEDERGNTPDGVKDFRRAIDRKDVDRRVDRDARSLARAAHGLRLRGGQGCLCRKTAGDIHRRRTRHGDGGRKERPCGPNGHAVA